MGILFSQVMDKLFGNIQSRICMVGLDAAGKTTIMYKLKLGENVCTIPTIGFNVEEIVFQNLTMTVWDIGGQKIIRPLWHHYYENNDAVIYVVDSSDRDRFDEAKEELWDMFNDDRLRNSSLLVLANKQDMPHAASASEITGALDLNKMTNKEWYVQTTCATSGEGLVDGLEWLARKVKDKKKGEGKGGMFVY